MKTNTIVFLFFIFFVFGFSSDRSYRLILEGDSLLPFRDINDVQSITFPEKNIISFNSSHGYRRTFDINTNAWEIKIYRRVKKIADNIEVKDTFPDWYQGYGVYHNIVSRKISRGRNDYILSSHANEGAFSNVEDIIDIKNKKVYRIPFQDTRFMEIIEPYIWLGCENGITRINIKTNKRVDFYVLPKFKEISGWVDYEGTRFITTEDGDIMKMDIDKETIDLVNIPKNILREGGISENNPIDDSRTANFTNPIIYNNKLYFSFYSTFRNLYSSRQSIIAIYDIPRVKWSYIKLSDNISGIQKLIVHRDMILCLGGLIEGYEGGDFGEFGGLSIVKGEKEIISSKELANVPIKLFELNKDTLSIITVKTNIDSARYFYHKISLTNLEIIDSREFGEKSTIFNRFNEEVIPNENKVEPILTKWLIKPKLIEVDKSVEIINCRRRWHKMHITM